MRRRALHWLPGVSEAMSTAANATTTNTKSSTTDSSNSSTSTLMLLLKAASVHYHYGAVLGRCSESNSSNSGDHHVSQQHSTVSLHMNYMHTYHTYITYADTSVHS
jgi:hypothetical protein